jgi:hypothetical protein
MSSDTAPAEAYWRMRRLTDDPGLVLIDTPPLVAAGTSEGARRAWESRQRAPPTPAPPPAAGPGNGLPGPDDFDAMEHTGGPLGSQGGGWYRDASGQRYLVKPGQSKTHAMNELAAHLLYKQAGIPTDDTGVFERNGKWYVAKKAVQGVDGKLGKQVGEGGMTADMQRQARDGFGVDALASSWDAFGLVGDNVIMEGGTLHRIDVGGSMMFRAMGGDKPSFNPGKEWIEPQTLRTSNQGKQLYGNMSNVEAAHQLAKLQLLDVGAYDRLLEATSVEPKVRTRVVATIRDRIDRQLPGILAHLDPKGAG